MNYTEIDKNNRGYPVVDPDFYRNQVRSFHDAGLHISTHTIGDRGIDWVVDSYELAIEANPISGLRHGIIHCNIPTVHAIDVMERLQRQYDAGYPESQATFMWWIGDTYAGNFGRERSLRFMPFKTYLHRGMKWGGGSDFNVTPFEARYGLWSTVTRKPVMGSYGDYPFGRDQSVDIRAALRSYTIWNAHMLFLEDKVGSIEPGKYADIAVWDKDIYTIDTDELKDLDCQLTLLEGEIVYRNPRTEITVSEPSD
jgi:predicted amidohydrolase YtcJ